MRDHRAQSETVGNVLLIGIVVIVTTTAMVGLFFDIPGGGGSSNENLLVDVGANATTENVSLSHTGGRAIDANKVTVVVSNGSAEYRFQLDEANLTGGDATYDPGETFTRQHGLTGSSIDVSVIIDEQKRSRVALDTTFSLTQTAATLGNTIWQNASDWDEAASERSVVHDDFGNHSAETVELGHSRDSPNLVGYWPLDEGTGASTATDVSPNDNDASVNGATSGVDGIANTSAYTFGDGDYLSVADSSSLDTIADTDAFTLSTWLQTDASDAQLWGRFDGYEQGSVGDDLVVGLRNGSLAALVGSDGILSESTRVDTAGEFETGTFENTSARGGAVELAKDRDIAYGTLEAPDSTGTAFAQTGFDPDVVVFRTYVMGESVGTTTSVGGQALGSGTGFADCTQQPCNEVARSFGSGSSSPNAQTSASTDNYSIQQVVTDEDGDSFLGRVNGTITETNGSGYTVSFENTVSSGPSVVVGYRAYAFDEGSDVDVGQFTTPASDGSNPTGTQSITTNHAPDSVQFVTGPAATAPEYIEKNTATEFGTSNGWVVDNESQSTSPITTTVGETGTFETPTETVVLGESGSVTVSGPGWETISFNSSYDDPIVVGSVTTDNGEPARVFQASNVSADSADVRICETKGAEDGCDSHGQETVSYVVINATAAEEVPGIDAGRVSIGEEIDTNTTAVSYDEEFESTPVALANTLSTNGTQPVEARVTDRSSNGFTVGICNQADEDSCETGHDDETVGWVAISSTKDVFEETSDVGVATGIGNSNWREVSFSPSFGEVPAVVASTMTDNGGQETQIDEVRNVSTAGASVRYCEIEETGTPDFCDSHTGETVGWFAVDSGTNLTAVVGGGSWKEVTFDSSYTDPVVVGSANTHNGESALSFQSRNVTSGSAEMRVCEVEGAADGCDFHGVETAGYVVVNATAAREVSGIDAGRTSVGEGIDTTRATVSFEADFGASPAVFANTETTNGSQPVEARVTSRTTGEFTVGICHQDGTDSCDDSHANETVGWVAIEDGNVFDQNSAVDTTTVGDSNWQDVSFSGFSQSPVVVASTMTQNGGQDTLVDEVKGVTTTDASVRYCEMEGSSNPDTCDTHADETVAWLALPNDSSLSVTTQPRPEQLVTSWSAYAENIDDHVYAARNDSVLNTLWTNKDSIDGRVRAHVDSLDDTGFTLDYTLNNPDTGDGTSFAVMYLSVNTSTEPELGYGRTPTTTGEVTYETSASLSTVSLSGTNHIPEMNSEGYSGGNEPENHLGWMSGGGDLAGTGQAVGFSSHSSSVNGHAVGSTTTSGFHLLYTDQDGNILGRDTARLAGTSGEQFTLNWTDTTTTATTNVEFDRTLFVWHSYGGTSSFESDGEYRRTFDANGPVYWNQTELTETVPSGTDTSVRFSDGQDWYDTIDQVPKTETMTVNVSLSTTASDTTPSVDAIETNYHNISLTQDSAIDNDSSWQSGTFERTETDGNGTLQLAPRQVGEAGTVTTSDGTWQTVSFEQSYSTPVVVGTTNSHDDNSALTFDARNVTSDSAEVRVCESEGAGGDGCDTHGQETVGYVVVDAAETGSIDGIETGTLSLDQGVNSREDTVSYTETFSSTPVVMANVQTTNGQQPVETRVTDTATSDFTVGICHQDSTNGCNDSHAAETVGWVALEPGNLPFETDAAVGATGSVVGDSEWESISFSSFSQPPVVVASTQTENGGQEAKIDEARSVTASGAEVRYCELESGDDCDGHNDENVAWLAVADGSLLADQATRGESRQTIDAGRVVNWSSAGIVSTVPSGTSVDVNYSDGQQWYESIESVPDSDTLTVNVTLSGTTSVRPTVDRVNVSYNATGWRSAGVAVNDSNWHHVTASYDGSSMGLFVDGTERNRGDFTTDIEATSEPAEIGGDSSGEWTFSGTLDAVRLYNGSRSASSIDAAARVDSDGVLRTAAGSFETPVAPTNLELTNVSAASTADTSVTLVVESDPDDDGDYEDRSDPIPIDGTAPYDVTGLNIESQRFRLRVELGTQSSIESPSFSGATLERTS